jgi:hypothetical protein
VQPAAVVVGEALEGDRSAGDGDEFGARPGSDDLNAGGGTASGRTAAFSKGMLSGIGEAIRSSTTVYCWKVPSAARLLSLSVPTACPSTRSPARKRVTARPTSTTSPATSDPRSLIDLREALGRP